MTLDKELKPCPFCGGAAKYEKIRESYDLEEFIECAYCGAQMSNYDESKGVEKAWNTRAYNKALTEAQERIKELKKENIELEKLAQQWHDDYKAITDGTDVIAKQALSTDKDKGE